MAIWDDPVLNSAFREPRRHYQLDEKGVPTGTVSENQRRRSEHLVPIPPPKKVKKSQR